MPAGLSPRNADEVNINVGTVCRQFESTRDATHAQQQWLVATDLTVPPYSLSAADQTLIKSAIATLDTALQAVDTTFIARLIGLPTS